MLPLPKEILTHFHSPSCCVSSPGPKVAPRVGSGEVWEARDTVAAETGAGTPVTPGTTDQG